MRNDVILLTGGNIGGKSQPQGSRCHTNFVVLLDARGEEVIVMAHHRDCSVSQQPLCINKMKKNIWVNARRQKG